MAIDSDDAETEELEEAGGIKDGAGETVGDQ